MKLRAETGEAPLRKHPDDQAFLTLINYCTDPESSMTAYRNKFLQLPWWQPGPPSQKMKDEKEISHGLRAESLILSFISTCYYEILKVRIQQKI